MARTFANSTGDNLQSSVVSISAAPLTMAAWVNLSAVGGVSRIIMSLKASGSADARNGFELRMNASEVVVAQASSNTNNATSSTSTTLTAGTPGHCAAVFASTTSRTAYIDGVAATPSATSISAPTGMDTTAIGVHHESSSLAKPWNGEIWEAGLWDVALTAAEITALARGYSPLLIRPGNLVSYWPIMGRTSPEIDIVGKNDLTVSGATVAAHGRIIMPQRRIARRPTTAVGGGGFQSAWAIGSNVVIGAGAR